MPLEQNGQISTSTNDIFKIVTNKTPDKIYRSLSDYILTVAKELGSEQSFYTIDLADVLFKVQLWKRTLPQIRPFYAVKTNSDPIILRFLVLLGFSFDCSSPGEIRMVLEAGGDPKNIIYAHTVKSPAALQYSLEVGVQLMTFDSEEELLKIHTHYPEARLLLRLVPEDIKCSYDLSEKFGCEIDDAAKILTLAKELNLNVIGVSFHVGGLCKNPNSYKATIKNSKQVFELAKTLGFEFSILDIGGGFRGEKGTEEQFTEVSVTVTSAIEEYFSEPGIEIVAEPGTYFVASAANLTTVIHGKRKNVRSTNVTRPIQRYYYLNDSIYGSFFSGTHLYGIQVRHLLDEVELNSRPVYNSRLWGVTSCGDDMLLGECDLPELEVEELLVWENMGAYNQVLCSTFCAQPLPATRHIFRRDSRINLECFSNKDILNFVCNKCTIIGEEQ